MKHLAVEKVETGRTRKVVLGFYMQSCLYMNDIKSAIGIQWLQQQHIFLRPQRMSFEHGTNLFLIGYLPLEHPTTANMENLEKEIKAKWFPMPIHIADDMSDDDNDRNHSAEYNTVIQRLTERGLINDGKLQFPATVERSVITVHAPDQPTFETQILSVFVPRKFKEAATLLNDFRSTTEVIFLSCRFPYRKTHRDSSTNI